MSVGSWNPDAEEAGNQGIDKEQLKRFIAWSEDDQLDQLTDLLSTDEQQTLAPLMQKELSDWSVLAEDYSDSELVALIRFFTVAENLPGWQAGDKSPVIALAKTLRKRGQKLERELLLWIREASDNRFLPYGPL